MVADTILPLAGRGIRALARPSLGSFMWRASGTETPQLVRQDCLVSRFDSKRGYPGFPPALQQRKNPSKALPRLTAACWSAWESASAGQGASVLF